MYSTELAALAARVAARHPDDDEAARVAEYAAQVETDHADELARAETNLALASAGN